MRSPRSRLTTVLAAATLLGLLAPGCGDDRFDAGVASFEPAAGWVVASEDTVGVNEVPSAAGAAAGMERVATLTLSDEQGGPIDLPDYVDVYRIPLGDTGGGLSEEQRLVALASPMAAHDRGSGPLQVERAELDGELAVEMTLDGAWVAGAPARVLIASRGDDAFIVFQAGRDRTSLAGRAVGFDAVVDSWRWE